MENNRDSDSEMMDTPITSDIKMEAIEIEDIKPEPIEMPIKTEPFEMVLIKTFELEYADKKQQENAENRKRQSNAERQRRYRERKKLEKLKSLDPIHIQEQENLENTKHQHYTHSLVFSPIEQNESVQTTSTVSKIRKAEYNREYYKKQKAACHKIKKTPKSKSERNAEYYKRRKEKQQLLNAHSQDFLQTNNKAKIEDNKTEPSEMAVINTERIQTAELEGVGPQQNQQKQDNVENKKRPYYTYSLVFKPIEQKESVQTTSTDSKIKKAEYNKEYYNKQKANRQPLTRKQKSKSQQNADYYRKRKERKQLLNAYFQDFFDADSQELFHAHSRELLDVYSQYKNSQARSSLMHHIRNREAHEEFKKKFTNNTFGHPCMVCDRLWFDNELTTATDKHTDILQKILPTFSSSNQTRICSTCKAALDKKKIPAMSVYNGFQYPSIPDYLPKLDSVSERLISPRIPFVQIRRLRHVHGQHGVYSQTINVPVSIPTMVHELPRDIDDDHCFNVHMKKKVIHKSSNLQGLVNKRKIKQWLQYLVDTPLYTFYDITVKPQFLQVVDDVEQLPPINEISEDISIEDSLTAQQHTLLWNKDSYLTIAPGEQNVPHRLLFNEHAEELCFPTIYLGQFRTFKEGVQVTSFMMASSELRRADRRGVTPYHLLYVAMKIMRLRVRDSLTVAFKFIGTNTNIIREQIESEDYINDCFESNLAFLRSIPNSAWYWADRKRDLFAIIRQIGKPTAFMTLTANEMGWTDLLQLLYKLRNNGVEIPKEAAAELSFIEKSTLINEDAVTCSIYFNKLVNVLITILQARKFSPFGKYRVVEYFKRIEFQNCGSPQVHILLWLENAPQDLLGEHYDDAIKLIDTLISVSPSQASEHINLQTHKHTVTCYKKIAAKTQQKCGFEAPFLPCRSTMILKPMKTTEDNVLDEDLKKYKSHYSKIRINLENVDYDSIEDFYEKNHIESDEHYIKILRAGISRVKVFLKRQPCEKWYNPFNPFVLSVLGSNTDFQIITDEYSCAAYVVGYVNKTNRGISNLQRQIVETMNEHPEFDIVEMTRKLSVDMLNFVELTSQEAAWYLLREPMSKSSAKVAYIPTISPIDRQRMKKSQQQLSEIHEDSTNIWKDFEKYQQRPKELENVTLAQFVSKYYKNNQGTIDKRYEPLIIRYRNYDMRTDLNNYKREMVTLHIPFRIEEDDVLAEMKFINIYDENVDLILQRRKEFESNFDIAQTIEICKQLCRDNELLEVEEVQS